MPTAVTQILDVEREPSASPSGAEPGRRFKLPAPLNTDDLLERNVWSPNRRNSSIVANGELRSSNSPRIGPGSLLAPQASGGSSLSSPKPATPTRFEDPLLSMPSFRRGGGSPVLDPASAAGAASPASALGVAGGAATPPLMPSPSFLRAPGLSATNSFSARRSSIDFRRSVPGAAAASVTSPGEAPLPSLTSAPFAGPAGPSRHRSLTRGHFDFGNLLDLTGYASPFAGSESGGPGLDDDEVGALVDPDHDTATAAAAAVAVAAGAGAGGLPGRRHSVAAAHGGGAGPASASAALAFASSASRPGGISPAARQAARNSSSEEEEFMARLQQNRASWRERPRGSSQGAGGALSLGGIAPAGSSLAPCEGGGLQNQTHAALEQLRGELKSLSMRSMHGAAPPPSGPAAGGGGGAAAAAAVAPAGGLGPMSNLGLARRSEGQAAHISPSLLSLSYTHSSSGAGGGGGAPPDLLPRRLACAHGGGQEVRVQVLGTPPAAARAL